MCAVLLSGFALGNAQHNFNAVHGLDNWIMRVTVATPASCSGGPCGWKLFFSATWFDLDDHGPVLWADHDRFGVALDD
jgi:hypothetical protein